MQPRESRHEVGAAVLFLLQMQVSRQRILSALENWQTYTPEKLGEHLLPGDKIEKEANSEARKAFRSGPQVYTDRLMNDWQNWLEELVNWKNQALAQYQRAPADVEHDLYDPRN